MRHVRNEHDDYLGIPFTDLLCRIHAVCSRHLNVHQDNIIISVINCQKIIRFLKRCRLKCCITFLFILFYINKKCVTITLIVFHNCYPVHVCSIFMNPAFWQCSSLPSFFRISYYNNSHLQCLGFVCKKIDEPAKRYWATAKSHRQIGCSCSLRSRRKSYLPVGFFYLVASLLPSSSRSKCLTRASSVAACAASSSDVAEVSSADAELSSTALEISSIPSLICSMF